MRYSTSAGTASASNSPDTASEDGEVSDRGDRVTQSTAKLALDTSWTHGGGGGGGGGELTGLLERGDERRDGMVEQWLYGERQAQKKGGGTMDKGFGTVASVRAP